MAKSKVFKEKAAVNKIIDGIIENAEIVSKTFGYNGKDILINRDGNTIITNDGVFVSNHIFLDDELEDLGSSLIRNITLNSDLISGDGTTSSAIITKGIVSRMKKILNKNNVDNLELKNGMLEAQKVVNNYFEKYRNKITKNDYYNVAFTTTRNEEISTLVSEVFEKIGSKGKVLFKESDAQGLSVEYQNGFTLEYGYETTMLPNILDNSLVALFKERINSVPVFQEIIKEAMLKEEKNLLIIVKDGIADAVMQVAIAVQQSKDIDLNLSIVKISGSEKIVDRLFKDVSIITSSKIIDNSFNYKEPFLGFVKKVTITDKQTTLVDGNINKKELKKHIENLTKTMVENRSESEKEDIRKRIGNLQGLVAIIKIGALSREKIGNYKDKIKDVVNSLRNAIDDGVVAGGGSVLFTISDEIKSKEKIKDKNKDFIRGYSIVLDSLKEPLKQIIYNSGYSENKSKNILKEISNVNKFKIEKNTYSLSGFDAKDRAISNLYEKGILDPYTTIINSFNNAIEISSMIATLDCAVVTRTEVFKDEGRN